MGTATAMTAVPTTGIVNTLAGEAIGVIMVVVAEDDVNEGNNGNRRS